MNTIISGCWGAIKASWVLKALIAFLAIYVFAAVVIPAPEPKTTEQIAAEQKANLERSQLRAVEDAVSSCNYSIKKDLKDPDSYKKRSVITLPLENKGGTRILIQYAAKNSFGGYVVEEAWCDSKIDFVRYREVF